MSASRSMDTSEMATAIRNNDYAGYQRARYPAVTDGDEVVFHDEDFSDVDFAGFNMGFMVFINCNLDGAKYLSGQPITLEKCSARGIDLRDTSTIINAKQSDLTGMLYDDQTVLANDTISSTLTDCQLDEQATSFLRERGVTIDE